MDISIASAMPGHLERKIDGKGSIRRSILIPDVPKPNIDLGCPGLSDV
jgi:hypothetical protein